VLERIRDRHPGVVVKLRQSSSGSAGNLQAVRDGFGTTLVPASAVRGERGEGLRAIPFDNPAMRWNLSAAVSADRQLTAAAKTLLAALIQGSR
jgi:DNA-binding transcriptional LysR family regulator